MPFLTQNTVPTMATWQDRVKDKQERILSHVPPQFVHPELKFSDTEAKDVLDFPVFSESNPARVMDFPGKFLSADELAIITLKAEDITPAILTGTWSAVKVLDAFTHRAVIAHQLLHCCLSFVYPQVREQAAALDAKFAKTGKLVGPLHGVPFSVKDQCRIKGTETTCGYVTYLGEWDEEDCLLVDSFKKAGAVPFCKTTLSVGCMWGESINNINIVGQANVLNFTACTLTVGKVNVASNPPDKSLAEDADGNTIPSPQCNRDRYIRENYARNLDEYQDMPLVLQIVAKRWEEEKVLDVCEVVEALVKKDGGL